VDGAQPAPSLSLAPPRQVPAVNQPPRINPPPPHTSPTHLVLGQRQLVGRGGQRGGHAPHGGVKLLVAAVDHHQLVVQGAGGAGQLGLECFKGVVRVLYLRVGRHTGHAAVSSRRRAVGEEALACRSSLLPILLEASS
jgi:hypothetical protein